MFRHEKLKVEIKICSRNICVCCILISIIHQANTVKWQQNFKFVNTVVKRKMEFFGIRNFEVYLTLFCFFAPILGFVVSPFDLITFYFSKN